MICGPLEFSTERLDAHQVGGEDLEKLEVLFQDERVTATLGGPRDRDRIRDDIGRWLAHWDAQGFGLWILRERELENSVGWVMLHVTDTGGPGVEVGWTIAADRWRRGLGSEAGAAAVHIGFETLGLHEIVSFTLVGNVASRRVMEHLGFTYDCETEHAGLPHVLYRLDHTTWEQHRNG